MSTIGKMMLEVKKLLLLIENNITSVIEGDSPLGHDLWNLLLGIHPADTAMLIGWLDREYQLGLLKKLPRHLSSDVFQKLSESLQAEVLVHLDIEHATSILNQMPADELTDLFDHLSDENLDKYLKLLQKKQRYQTISLLNFDPQSAGGRMDSGVVTLQKDFTIKKSIELLQRLHLKHDLRDRIYVTNRDHVLVGYVTLDKLVFNKPDLLLSNILKKNEIVIRVDEDQEEVANQIHHYDLPSAPVVDMHNHFLGVITDSDVVDIIKQEESEDVYKRFGLSAVEYSYFETSAWKLILQRSSWLVGLLLLQSVSSMILGHYDGLIKEYAIITIFLGMLTGTGGNAGNQSATLVIRGLTTKEISRQNAHKVLLREFGISLVIGLFLVIVGAFRVYQSHPNIMSVLVINIPLFLIVVSSMMLGTVIPLILQAFNIDPAYSAAPFLTTMMDIIGVIIFCVIFNQLLG